MEIKKIPFGLSFNNPAETASMFSKRVPALICDNDCIIVTGKSLLNAFDRLEVAEFTAKSIIQSKCIGKIVHINEEEKKEIDEEFNLMA